METLLAFMNHFPLFALVLRVKDPWRLPGPTSVRSYPLNTLTVADRWHILDTFFDTFFKGAILNHKGSYVDHSSGRWPLTSTFEEPACSALFHFLSVQ
jgi:hypothetical protein